MKNIPSILLLSFIYLVFTGCSNESFTFTDKKVDKKKADASIAENGSSDTDDARPDREGSDSISDKEGIKGAQSSDIDVKVSTRNADTMSAGGDDFSNTGNDENDDSSDSSDSMGNEAASGDSENSADNSSESDAGTGDDINSSDESGSDNGDESADDESANNSEDPEEGDEVISEEEIADNTMNSEDANIEAGKNEIAICKKMTGAARIKIVSSQETIAVDPETVLFVKVTGNQSDLTINFAANEEELSYAGICIFATGNQSNVSLNIGANVDVIAYKARGNRAALHMDIDGEASVTTFSHDLNGNGPLITVSGNGTIDNCNGVKRNKKKFTDICQ